MSRPLSTGQLDAVARQRGFPDYATWAAWNRQRSSSLQQPASAPAPPNFLQALLGKIPFHPTNLLNYVNKKISGE